MSVLLFLGDKKHRSPNNQTAVPIKTLKTRSYSSKGSPVIMDITNL